MTSQLTPAGLTIPTQEELTEQIKQGFKDKFGVDFNTDDESVAGIIADVFGSALVDSWQTVGDVYASQDPAQSIGKQQDDNYALVDVIRIEDSKSEVVCQVVGDNGVVLPAGQIVNVDSTQNDFDSASIFTFDQANAQSVVYQIDSPIIVGFNYVVTIDGATFSHIAAPADTVDIVSNAISAQIDADPDLTSSYSAGPQTFDATHVNPLVDFNSSTSANISIIKITGLLKFESQEIGPIAAPADKLINIKKPITGWDSCINPESADLGTFRESDTAYRVRRNRSLLITGRSTLGALQANLLQLVGVSGVKIFENVLDVVDQFGLLPHSIQVVIDGGDDQEIGQTILDINTGGIATNGNVVVNAVDVNGNFQIVRFIRPTLVNVYVEVTYTPDPNQITPENVVDLIKNSVVQFGNSLGDDKNVIPQHFCRPIYEAVPDGILNLVIGMSLNALGPFLPDEIVIDRDKKSFFDNANVAVIEAP